MFRSVCSSPGSMHHPSSSAVAGSLFAVPSSSFGTLLVPHTGVEASLAGIVLATGIYSVEVRVTATPAAPRRSAIELMMLGPRRFNNKPHYLQSALGSITTGCPLHVVALLSFPPLSILFRFFASTSTLSLSFSPLQPGTSCEPTCITSPRTLGERY